MLIMIVMCLSSTDSFQIHRIGLQCKLVRCKGPDVKWMNIEKTVVRSSASNHDDGNANDNEIDDLDRQSINAYSFKQILKEEIESPFRKVR